MTTSVLIDPKIEMFDWKSISDLNFKFHPPMLKIIFFNLRYHCDLKVKVPNEQAHTGSYLVIIVTISYTVSELFALEHAVVNYDLPCQIHDLS